MCGIVGIYERDGRPVAAPTLDRMTDALSHRGPDGRGVWIESSIGLGHRRLSIRDLSSAGAQPFHSACGRVVVTYNGEIYNDRALARELELKHGFAQRTRCDTEILPAGWLAWGLELFERLEGIYALALWDRQRQELVLARDAFGVKPLYVADDGNTVRFGSEVKGIIADPAMQAQIAPEDAAALLALGHVGPDRSLLRGVRQIAPGTVRLVDARGSVEHRFWTPRRQPRLHSMTEARDGFISRFHEVVSDQLVSDVPLAVLQSGGIDSSLISLALPANASVRLYNVRFPERDFDESKLAGELAKSAMRPIEFLDLDGSDDQKDFQSVVRAVDGALADSSTLAAYRLSRRIRSAATTALSGDGADEFFAGYPTYRATAAAKYLQPGLPPSAWARIGKTLSRQNGFSASRLGPMEAVARFCAGLSLDVPHTGWRSYLLPWDRGLLYGPELHSQAQANPLAAYGQAYDQAEGDVWDKGLLADQRYYLPADMLMKLDRASMAHGLEIRVPFLDRRVAGFAAQLDRHLLATYCGKTKRVLRAAAEQLGAPASITNARKHGFNIPMNRLLANGLKPLADRLLDRGADILMPYCSADGVRRIWTEHRDGVIDRRYVVWTLLTLAVWREQSGV